VDVARTVGSSAPETRRGILDSAAELFAEHGYSSARMLDIAERLGISKSALYYHFASKEDLLEGLVEPVMRALDDVTAAAESGKLAAREVLRRYVDALVAGMRGLHPLMMDAAAREVVKSRFGPVDSMRRLEAAFATLIDAPDTVLRAQFVLGGIRSTLMTRLFATAPDPPEVHAPHPTAASGAVSTPATPIVPTPATPAATRPAHPGGAVSLSEPEREALLDVAMDALRLAP
jgi:AcrR family transcriptional regulator